MKGKGSKYEFTGWLFSEWANKVMNTEGKNGK